MNFIAIAKCLIFAGSVTSIFAYIPVTKNKHINVSKMHKEPNLDFLKRVVTPKAKKINAVIKKNQAISLNSLVWRPLGQGQLQNKYNIKYILQWIHDTLVPFREGRQEFIDLNCRYTNCYITSNKTYLQDYKFFDVITFLGPEVVDMSQNELPERRSPHQKFVFAATESSHYYPVCTKKLDGYFNWTWTYKLDSDANSGFMVIRDSEGKIIGPKKDMHWMKTEDMNPVNEGLKILLQKKNRTAVWFVSQCETKSRREIFFKNLALELEKYNLKVKIYGYCGTPFCQKSNKKQCYENIKKYYYFYLSFEDSLSEDYVTGKLLRAIKHNTIPIVYGGANYSRFLPDGSYLNARELGVKKLAFVMQDLIENKDKYAEYFRWKNHYSYHHRNEQPETNVFCSFCSLLNVPARALRDLSRNPSYLVYKER